MPPPMMMTFSPAAGSGNGGAAEIFSSTGIASVVIVENLFGVAVESDAPFWRFGRRREERQEFLVDVAQGGVVQENGFVNLGKTLEDGGVGGEFLAHLHKGADDVKTHLDGLRAVQDIGSLQRAVFGENLNALGKFEAGQGCHSLRFTA